MFRKKKKKGKPLTFELKFKAVADNEAIILHELWEEITIFFVGRLQERTNLGQIRPTVTNDLLIQLGRPPLVTSDVEKKKLADIFDSAFKIDQSSFDEVFASLGSAAKEAAPTITPTITPAPTPTPMPTPVSTPTPPAPTPVSTPTPPAPTPVSTPTPPAPTSVSTPTPPAPTSVSTPSIPSVPSVQTPTPPPTPAKEEDRATGIALLRKEMLSELKELRSILDE